MTKNDEGLDKLVNTLIGKFGQKSFLTHWHKLSIPQKKRLIKDLEKINPQFITDAKIAIQNTNNQKPLYSSFTSYESQIIPEWEESGTRLLEEGKCALLVLAGGSGSRLGFNGPKGCFPITNIRKKSLFQYIAEKVKAVSKLVKRPLEMAIMTSPSNSYDTKMFFQENHNFGLLPTQVHFFCQEEWPLLSIEGELFLEDKDRIAVGPNGNGDALKELYASPIFARWQMQGVECLNVIPVENPMADPFDAVFLGFHHMKNSEVTIKATHRQNPREKVGVIVDGGQVVEYGEVRLQNEKEALAYIGLFCIRFSAISHIQKVSLPLHPAKKLVKKWDISKNKSLMTFAWKFERFLFDIFPHLSLSANRQSNPISVLCYPRKKCFAPLKNFEGDDSISVVQKQLQEADREAFYRVSGTMPPAEASFELSLEFYYPTPELKKQWQGQHILRVPNNSYIEGS